MSSSRLQTTFTGFPVFLRAPPLPPRSPETTSGRIRRPAASHSPSRLPFSSPPLARSRSALPVDPVTAPRLPLFHRDTPPRPPAVPSKHVPAEARSILLR